MLGRITFSALTLVIAQPALAQPQVESETGIRTINKPENPVKTCVGGTPNKSGFYWVQPENQKFIMYCDMETGWNNAIGGWTLVWSNLRGGAGKLTTNLHWGASIQTLPRYKGISPLFDSDLQSFEVYTGLRFWKIISELGKKEIMYEWAHDYGDPNRQISRRAACKFSLNSTSAWTIIMDSCERLIGNDLPGLFTSHSGRQWTTVDRDNDVYTSNCSVLYSGTPWWYAACWDGSFNGGGEYTTSGHYNGAHWKGADPKWGVPDGTGAGNGWIYVR